MIKLLMIDDSSVAVPDGSTTKLAQDAIVTINSVKHVAVAVVAAA